MVAVQKWHAGKTHERTNKHTRKRPKSHLMNTVAKIAINGVTHGFQRPEQQEQRMCIMKRHLDLKMVQEHCRDLCAWARIFLEAPAEMAAPMMSLDIASAAVQFQSCVPKTCLQLGCSQHEASAPLHSDMKSGTPSESSLMLRTASEQYTAHPFSPSLFCAGMIVL